jgi:hypothetical protein
MYKWSILNVSQLVWKCQRMNNRTRCDIFRNIRIYRIQMEKIALIAKESSYILFSSSCCRLSFSFLSFHKCMRKRIFNRTTKVTAVFSKNEESKTKGNFRWVYCRDYILIDEQTTIFTEHSWIFIDLSLSHIIAITINPKCYENLMSVNHHKLQTTAKLYIKRIWKLVK